jgi:hypothetical protein
MGRNGWLDSKSKTFRTKGLDISGIEKALKKDRFLRPIGLATEKEFGKTITQKEYMRKGRTTKGSGFATFGAVGFDALSFGVVPALRRINRRVQQRIKKVRR